jgi:acetyltransferase-like isoleucine patch superfamily enzyme
MKLKFLAEGKVNPFYNLWGHVRIRAYIRDDSYIDIGRFSSGAITRIRLCSNAKFNGLLAHIGDYCEFSECDLLLGGEHQNDKLINLNFSSSPVFQQLLSSKGVDVRHSRKGPIQIGDGVVIGYGVIVMSGVSIASGSMIGAGSVVTKDCDEFGIYAGNPARFIKKRLVDRDEFEKFVSSTVEGSLSILTGLVGSNGTKFDIDQARENRLVISIEYADSVKGGSFGYKVLGALVQGKLIPMRKGSLFYEYAMQAQNPSGQEVLWHSDPLSLEM